MTTQPTCHADTDREMWKLPNGDLHREDGPAVIHKDTGMCEWWQNGRRHRSDGPAVSSPDGQQQWFQKGFSHRVDGPAKISPDGHQQWCQNGVPHRVEGPAKIRPDGTEEWFEHGLRHRTDGPATHYPEPTWYVKGRLVDITKKDGSSFVKNMGYGFRTLHPSGAQMSSLVTPPDASRKEDVRIALNYIAQHMDVDMLQSRSPEIAAVVAWNLPVDEHYFDVALTTPTVFDIMRCRTDIPDPFRTLIQVVA